MNDTIREGFWALSIRQYWLHAILNFNKQIENRTWKPPQKHIGTRIALHASQQIDRDGAERVRLLSGYSRISFKESTRDIATGAILATAKLEGFCTQSSSRWFIGPYGWILKDIYVFKEPYPCKGQLRLWRVPYETAKDIIFEEIRGPND